MEAAERGPRLLALDVVRGATIAGMIVVNNPGTWAHVYPQLLHAEWHGWTYTDTIFPFFLFTVGVSIVFSFGARRRLGASFGKLALHTLRRAAILFGIGLALNLLSFAVFSRATLRIPGVLQRIAICFLAAGLIYLGLRARGAAAAGAVLLLGYWALMALVPVPGFGTGRMDLEGNLAAYTDRAILGAHTWKPGWDPEGPLSTVPAIATTLMGILAGEWLRGNRPMRKKMTGLVVAGTAAAFAGLAWHPVFPINKNLWTSSYALFMAGLAAVALGACIAVVDLAGWKRWAAPFRWLGMNAIAAFVLSTATTILLLAVQTAGPDGKPRSLYATIYRIAFDRFADPRLGSLLFSLSYLALWFALFGLLHRKRVFVKI
ncbi:MAG: acyltransferase family protein [Thermoanaerobaculia bacterium]